MDYVMVFQTWTIEKKIDDAGQDSKKVDKGEIAKSGKTGDVIWKFHFKKGLEMFYYSNYVPTRYFYDFEKFKSVLISLLM